MLVKRYALYGRVVSSVVELPGVTPARDQRVAWTVEIENVDPSLDSRTVWFHVLDAPKGARAMRFGAQAPGRYVVTTEAEASFLIDLDARRIGAHLPECVDPATAVHLICDQIVPLALAAAGDFVLHASAVEREGLAIAFAGPSGSGKSTLAAAMVRRSGWRFLTDDALRLQLDEQVVAWPGYPSVRLWPDSVEEMRMSAGAAGPVRQGGEKMRIAVENASVGPMRLARLFILDAAEAEAVSVEPVGPRDAVMALARSTFRLDFRDGATMAGELAAARNLVEAGLIRRLRFERSYGRLAEIVARMDGLSIGGGESDGLCDGV